MGPLICKLQSHHKLITLVMGLYRYIIPMFLIILSTNIILTKEEETRDQEDVRQGVVPSGFGPPGFGPSGFGSGLAKNKNVGTECDVVNFFLDTFCNVFTEQTFKKKKNVEGALSFCNAMISTSAKISC